MTSAPYGSWKSPITSELIVSAVVDLGQLAFDGNDVYWIEQRPTEDGRNVVVQRTPDGRTLDRTPPPFNARTRVHEYGGGAYVVQNGSLYFSNFADQRVYRQQGADAPQPLSQADNLRYADSVIDRTHNRLLCVREDHRQAEREAVNTIVGLDLDSGTSRILVSGHDFYSSPRLSPDGRHLAWLSWNHPNMPWDGVELWYARLQADGSPGGLERIAGGADESIFQPEWSPDGELYFVSDRTDWWNIYRFRDGQVEALCDIAAEFGLPQWAFGMSTYGFASAERIICAYTQNGTWRLASLDTRTQASGRHRHPLHRYFRPAGSSRPGGLQRRLTDQAGLYCPAGEQHGFRRAENIRRALDGELYFYSRIFGFELAEPVESVHIENL